MTSKETGVKVPLIVVILMVALIIFLIIMSTVLGIQGKRQREVIEIYEEYYAIDEKMDLIYRNWSDWYPQYMEEEYYLKFHPETYLRYLELKKIIGEFEK